jgi:hypothetical protein
MKRVLLPLTILLLAAVPLPAQVIRGRLLDANTGQAITDGQLSVLGDDHATLVRAESDGKGSFTLDLPGEGQYQLRAEHDGHRTATSTPIRAFRGDTIEVEFRLSARLVLLTPLVVTAPSRGMRTGLAGYYSRLASPTRLGRFVTRQQIERRHPSFASDLLRGVAGVKVIPRVVGGSGMVLLRECEPQLYLDGMRVHLPHVGIDELVTPQDLEGIEVYGSSAEVPVELGGSNSICGAIALWTRR